MMLALWIWAAIFWIEGIDSDRPVFLAASVILIAASALTKYFGAALVPLLLCTYRSPGNGVSVLGPGI